MTEKELEAIFEGISRYTEVLTGMRNQLILQGFSPLIAEQLVLEAMKGK